MLYCVLLFGFVVLYFRVLGKLVLVVYCERNMVYVGDDDYLD